MPVTEREFMELKQTVAVMQAELSAYKEAVKIAKQENDRRLEGMNKFREEAVQDKIDFLSRKEGPFVSQAEWKTAHDALITRVDERFESSTKDFHMRLEALNSMILPLQNRQAWMSGRDTIVMVLASALVAGLVAFLFRLLK